MSGKALKSLKDENPDLQKQIGCITGFFQLFDRHRFLTGQHTSGYIQHKSTSGGNNSDIRELNSAMQKTKAKNMKISREKQQFSTESSMTSVSSSSCSSSMSSHEFNRTIQTESPSTNQIRIPQNSHSEVAAKQHHTPCHQSLDFYDIVKDSIHREAQGLSVKTVAKEGKKSQPHHTLKHIDSPRPLRSNTVNARNMVANEPFHIPSKSKKTPWDSPRLSYDERNMQDTFISSTKHKELPRFSLDSRERSIRGSNEANKAHNLLKCQQKGYGRNSNTMPNQLQEPEISKRSSSVVAKLMGFEAPQDLTQTCGTSLGTSRFPTNKNELLARSSTSDEYKQNQSSASQKTSHGFNLPQSRRADSITNVTPYSRFVLEPTLWRQPDASQNSQLQGSKGSETDVKASKSPLSVYGEIEKRLAELEFTKSGKDLRALKQIIQRHKDSSDIARDQTSNSPSDNRFNTSLRDSTKVQSSKTQQKNQASVTVEMSNSTRRSKLPIVIMKPAKINKKANNPSSSESSPHHKSGLSNCSLNKATIGRSGDKQTAKGTSSTTKNIKEPFGQSVRPSYKNNNMKTSKLMQSSKVIQDSNITVNGSPRLQRKFDLERRSLPTSPLSDSSINRRQHHNRQPAELSSPSTTPRRNFSTFQERNDCFGEIGCHWRDFKHHVNIISPDFGSKRSLATHSDIEVIRMDQSGNINSTSIQLSGMDQNIAFEELRKESYKAETIVTAEQPSPVSVLDPSFYREDPPSPVKKKSDISKLLGETLSTDEDNAENSVDLYPLSSTTKANSSNGSSDRDLNTQNLVQIFQEIDWNDEKFINFNNGKDPDHKYISEILFASGLLNGNSSSQILNSSRHVINPELFFALEQMKANKGHLNTEESTKKIASVINPEQMQRKLIFDVVNDILVQKLIFESSFTLCCQPNKPEGQQLLDELCTEIDQLQPQNRNVNLVHRDESITSLLCGDLKHHHTIWTKCSSEEPNIVLDIERLIFKDLITEVVKGEAANHFGRHCKQLLFPK